MERLYQDFLDKIGEGLKYRDKHVPYIEDLNTLEEIHPKIQQPLLIWWEKNGISDDNMSKLLSSKYRDKVLRRFVLFTGKGE
jgi:uncharacterized protein YjaG (DUF416 family)